jgi:hypothetical protein
MAGQPSVTVAALRASKARRLQSYPAGHPKVHEVGEALDYEMLAEHAARVVSTWPMPSKELLAKVTDVLRTARAGAV